VRLLLEAKVNIDGKDNDGWTALHGAAYGYAEVVRLLLEAKADVEVKEFKAWMDHTLLVRLGTSTKRLCDCC
jgi:ankyrin repeat protein